LVLSDETASKYIIREIDGSAYMFFGWKTTDYTQLQMRPHYYVLKKVSVESLKYKPWYGEKAEIPATSYFNEQGNIVDKIDYPFINDSKVIGTWKSVDFVPEIEDFKDSEKQWEHGEDRPYLKQIIFLPKGKTTDNYRTWTKGLIFHSGNKTAGKYTIKKIKGSTFMFFEWKNDSYTSGYMKTKYYVLKKVSP
jgi:bla regulator protein BlaR1